MTVATTQDGGGETQARGAMLAEISNEMVGLYKTLFGRGPTRARTNWAGPDTLLCTLEDSLTPAEKSLVELGESQRLRDVRLFFQYATEDRFRDVIERLTGREVRGFISGMDVGKDIAAELFYLAPDKSAQDEESSPG
jgi:uncharacterized protein YbcI